MELKPIIDFLSELNLNNSTEWMSNNKQQFHHVKGLFESFIEELIIEISKFDSSIVNLTAKDCTFRLNRDIRFSKDKRPYKEYFSAYIIAGGKKNMNAGYYIQIHHGDETLIAGGMHVLTKEMLKSVRERISLDGNELVDLINAPQFKSVYPSVVGDSLKKAPSGFSPDDPYIDLVKMKNFDFVYNYDNKVLLKDSFLKDVVSKFALIKPVNDFFNSSVESL